MEVRDGKRERIAKALARAGVASRRDSELLVKAGRVAVNGAIVGHPATLVSADDVLTIDGKEIAPAQRTRVWRYHKPAGLVTTARDPEGRPTVFSALPAGLPRVISIGRLDINTEGLLLLTNDGEFARYLEHPSQAIPRTYRIRAHGSMTPEALQRLTRGITIEGVIYRPVKVSVDRQQGSNCWMTMTLSEGKNREIKRLLEHLGLQVTRLIRIGYGPFDLDTLAPNAIAEVSPTLLPALLPDYFRRFLPPMSL